MLFWCVFFLRPIQTFRTALAAPLSCTPVWSEPELRWPPPCCLQGPTPAWRTAQGPRLWCTPSTHGTNRRWRSVLQNLWSGKVKNQNFWGTKGSGGLKELEYIITTFFLLFIMMYKDGGRRSYILLGLKITHENFANLYLGIWLFFNLKQCIILINEVSCA